jgi:cytochrome b561
MQIRNTELRYGVIAQVFHWAVVALVIAQFVLAIKAHDLPLGPAKIAVLAQHKSIGLTIFGLAVLRLVWRLLNPVPALPPTTPHWQRIVAHVSHGALYALILITPLFGWMMSSARNFPVSWFGLFTLPDLVSPDKAKYELFHGIHKTLAITLASIAVVHVLAALKHHFLDRDDVLRRMLPTRSRPDRH